MFSFIANILLLPGKIQNLLHFFDFHFVSNISFPQLVTEKAQNLPMYPSKLLGKHAQRTLKALDPTRPKTF